MTEGIGPGELFAASTAAGYATSVLGSLTTKFLDGILKRREIDPPDTPARDRLREISREAFDAMLQRLPDDLTVGSMQQADQALYAFFADHAISLPLIVAGCGENTALPQNVRDSIQAAEPRLAALGISLEMVVHEFVEAIRELLRLEGLENPDSPLLPWLVYLSLQFPTRIIPPPNRPLPLDADLSDFVGREDEEDQLLAALDLGEARAICAIGGMGGIGKTALAVRVAHQLEDDCPDGQFQIDLQGFSETEDPLTPRDAMARLIAAFAPTKAVPETEAEARALYGSLLADKTAFILLDNAANVAQAQPLIVGGRCAFLVTSRKTIALDGHAPIILDVLTEQEAFDLLRELLSEERASDEELGELAQVCARLPLTLRAAAAYLNVYTTETARVYIDEVGERRATLGMPGDPTLDVQNILGWSARRLGQENADWLVRWGMLSVFPGTFDLAAAAGVCDTDESETRLTFRELHTRNLVLYDPETGRYNLHDLMRSVARNALTPEDGAEDGGEDARMAAQFRHADHYLAILSSADDAYQQGGEEIVRSLALVDGEWDNIVTGQRWAAAHAGSDAEKAQLCNAYPNAGAYVLNLRLHAWEWIAWLEAALGAARSLADRAMEGGHLGNLGLAYFALGDARHAIEYYEQALEIHRVIRDRRGEGQALGNLGIAYSALGDARRAIEYYEKALEIHRVIRDRRGEGNLLCNLGIAYRQLGDARRAIEYHEQSLEIAREIGDRRGQGYALSGLGLACGALGDARRAIEYHEKALVIDREIDDRRGEGYASWNMSLALHSLGEREQAIARAEEALTIFEAIEHPGVEKVRRKLAEWRGEGDEA